MMSKRFRGGREASLARPTVNQVMRSECLDQSRLAVTAGAEYNAAYVIGRAPALDHVNRALLARIFPGRRARLYGVRHFCELVLLLGLGQRPDLFFKHFLGGGHAFHDLAIEQAAYGAHIRDLGMVLKPNRLGKSAPWERELGWDIARNTDFIATRARPWLVTISFQIVGFGRNHGKNRLR